MVADVTAIVGEVSHDFLLKRHEPEFRPLCLANYEPTELLIGDDLKIHERSNNDKQVEH